MVEYVREGEDRFGIRRSGQVVGAILRRRTNPCDVDTWRLCYDLGEMLRHDSREVIYGGTEAEIESEIWKRHPVEGAGVALVTGNRTGTAWEVERTARLMHADLNMLQEACAIHKRVLVGDELVQELGGEERLAGLGFLLEDRSSRWAKLVRYNPRQVAVNRWKGQVEELSRYFRPEFPPELMDELLDAVKPDCWHDGHPYRGFLKTECKVTATEDSSRGSWGSRRHRRRGRHEHVNLSEGPRTIFAFIQIAGRLGTGEHRRPWRRTSLWKELLERMVEYVHGVERNGDADWKRLARWVRAEARAAGVKLPRPRKLPPRPTFGKRAVRRRSQPELVASPREGVTHERTRAHALQAVS